VAEASARTGAPADAPTGTTTDTATAAPHRDGELVHAERLLLDELSDRLDTIKLLRADDDAHADAILEQFGAKGRVESDMLDQLAVRRPLAVPERFEEAHHTAMRALEVFDRNAARPPSNLRAGFLTPVASPVVQMLLRIIVRTYQRTVINRLRELYARREAASEKGSREFGMLRLARLQADRLAPGFQKSSGGLPTFLVGGAVLSGVASALQEIALSAAHDAIVLLIVTFVLAALALGAFWCVLQAAGIARRRTRIALDQPLRAVWETLGAAGSPPKDESRQFATIAIVLLALAWVVVPAGIAYAVHTW
jgi:hypothetical protein